MDRGNTPSSERNKPEKPKTLRCSLEVRGLPLDCFRLPGDGRKWHQAARSRYKLLLTLASYANPDGTYVRDGINFSPQAKTLQRHIASATLYRLTNDLHELGWLSWTREKTHYGRRTYRIHFPTQKQVSDSIEKHLSDSRIREVITPLTTGGVIEKTPLTTGGVITSHIGGQLQETAPVKSDEWYSPPSFLKDLPSLEPPFAVFESEGERRQLSPNTESKTAAAAEIPAEKKQPPNTVSLPDPMECWQAIGSEIPIGLPEFQEIWRFRFSHRNGTSVGQAMEQCCQDWQRRKHKVPPPFLERKRALEAQQKQSAPGHSRRKRL